ncbi:ferredoxin [Candidatus Falkowbacteria bacterium]|nr:MAG: ferredoxin [Candidatus Falkowbacteria bacterium]
MKKINIKINNKDIACDSGKTIFVAAMQNGIEIPGLCGHPDFCAKANCRVCVVEIKGKKRLVTSCSTLAEDGMEIKTDTPRVKKARNLNLELIFAEHIEKCPTCVWRFECKLLKYAEKYKILITTFRDRKRSRKTYKFANAVEIDGSQCIDCRNCIDACSVLQNINYLELKGKGASQEVVPVKNKNIHCILCGQCAVHCPVSAAQEQTHWEVVEKALKNEKKIVVAQFAPSIRVSIGEDFGMPYGKIVTEQIVTGLKDLGFNYVFDVNFGADITTMVEAEELLGRLANGAVMPMITSCCPAWVNYVEFYHPQLIPNLTTARSPHIHSGGVIKTYWADKMKIDPKNIITVSIMPCTAKKYEASRTELKINGQFPVDYVLTTREFSFMLKKNNIDFKNLKKTKADNPLGEYSGAAAIYGGSGGVMESALRTANFMARDDNTSGVCRRKIEFKEARGLEGVKEAEIEVGGKKLRIAVVNGIGNIEPVINALDKYHYIEVMACPGGCIGGGGQPIPTTPEIRKKRIAALYRLDKSKKIRMAHENKNVAEILGWVKNKGHKFEHKLLHTKFKKKIKY